MTTIKQLQEMPAGQGTGGYTLSIKTYKKTWQSGKIWWSQVICMDDTGEMPVDVNVGKAYNPLRGRARVIHVTVAEVQDAEYLGKDRKKLVVDQYTIPTQTIDDYYKEVDEIYDKELKVVQSKIRCLLSCSILRKDIQPITPTTKRIILGWQEFILTGE